MSRVSPICQALVGLWLALSAALLFVPAALLDRFAYKHDWVSAHFATMARTFAEVGIVALRGVPVQNNLPLTASPDIYVNWPPLYSYVLSLAMRAFGSGERVVHTFACTVTLAIAVLLFVLMRRRLGTFLAMAGTAAFLNAPIIATYGHMAAPVTFCLALVLASVLFYLIATEEAAARRSRAAIWGAAAASIALYVLAVAASWEAVLVSPALLVHALVTRDRARARLSLVLGVAGAATVVAVGALYFTAYPDHFDALVARLKLRAGFGMDYDATAHPLFDSPHFIQERGEPDLRVSAPVGLAAALARLDALGPLGGFALALLFFVKVGAWRRPVPLAPVFVAFGGMFTLWALLMPHHVVIHDYQTLMMAPLAGVGFAVLLATEGLGTGAPSRASVALVLSVIVVGLAFRLDATRLLIVGNDRTPEIRFMERVAATVPERSIVLLPGRSMVPVYYAERHGIRRIGGDGVVDQVVDRLPELCASCAYYVVVPHERIDRFARSLSRYPVVFRSEYGQLLEIPNPALRD